MIVEFDSTDNTEFNCDRDEKEAELKATLDKYCIDELSTRLDSDTKTGSQVFITRITGTKENVRHYLHDELGYTSYVTILFDEQGNEVPSPFSIIQQQLKQNTWIMPYALYNK